jgi:hypothetical protein
MINILIENTRPMTGWGIACVVEPEFIKIPELNIISDICICDNEIYEEIVFNQNDIRSFISETPQNTDTISFILVKDGEEYNLVNSTYGTYYGYGSLDGHPNYKGYQLDFGKVFNELGVGKYKVITRREFLGVTDEKESHYYRLYEYNEKIDRKYVKIEIEQNNNILRGFDYSGLLWYNALRLQGSLQIATPEYVTDNTELNETSNREMYLGVNKILRSYEIAFNSVPSSIYDYFTTDAIFGETFKITSFSKFKNFDKLPVYVDSLSDLETSTFSKLASFKVKIKDRSEGIIRY